MRIARVILLALILALPNVCLAQTTTRANRAWKPFFTAFRAAIKKRDRDAIMKMMAKDFYFLSSGGDENGNNDSRDEAFDYWETTGIGSWDALEKALAQGVVTNTAMLDHATHGPSRISPPLANSPKAIKARSFPWYAIFEYRDGAWYWTAFTECCD